MRSASLPYMVVVLHGLLSHVQLINKEKKQHPQNS